MNGRPRNFYIAHSGLRGTACCLLDFITHKVRKGLWPIFMWPAGGFLWWLLVLPLCVTPCPHQRASNTLVQNKRHTWAGSARRASGWPASSWKLFSLNLLPPRARDGVCKNPIQGGLVVLEMVKGRRGDQAVTTNPWRLRKDFHLRGV